MIYIVNYNRRKQAIFRSAGGMSTKSLVAPVPGVVVTENRNISMNCEGVVHSPPPHDVIWVLINGPTTPNLRFHTIRGIEE